MSVFSKTRIERGYRTNVPRKIKKFLEIGESAEVRWIFEDGKVLVRKKGVGMARYPYCGFEEELRLIASEAGVMRYV